jgi:hypothetical protein
MASKELPFFEKGKPIWQQITAAKLNAIVDYIRKITVIPSSTIGVRQIAGGTELTALVGRGGGSSSFNHPWKVSVRPKADAEGEFEAMVNSNSYLLQSLQPDDDQTVTDLGTWFDFIANDVIWIEITIDAGEITGASIDSYGQGDSTFDPTADAYTSGAFVEDDGGSPLSQTKARMIIAYSVPDGDGNPTLTQVAFNHVVMRYFCLLGISTGFPMPSPYGRYP